MTLNKIGFTTGRIHGLTKDPYYNKEKLQFFWDITFSNISTVTRLENLTAIKVGNTKEEAEEFCNELKNRFKKLGINDGDMVKIMYTSDGSVRAIKRTNKTTLWIDVDDKFAIKDFNNLNVGMLIN